jgi:hypothetical protein
MSGYLPGGRITPDLTACPIVPFPLDHSEVLSVLDQVTVTPDGRITGHLEPIDR